MVFAIVSLALQAPKIVNGELKTRNNMFIKYEQVYLRQHKTENMETQSRYHAEV